MSRRAGSTWCSSPSSSSSAATPPTPASASRITPREAGLSFSPSRSSGTKRRGQQRASTPPTSSPSSVLNGAASPHSSPTIAVKFAGKIFRTLDTKLQGVEYSSEANFLGEPDEQVGDLERERADERRKRLERAMLVEAPEMTDKRRRGTQDPLKDTEPSKRARTLLSRHESLSSLSASSPTTSPVKAETPTRRRPGQSRHEAARTPSPPPAPFLARTLPTSSAALSQAFALETSLSKKSSLPPALADLVALHAALEGALIMHLGTSGWAVASSAVTEHHPDGSSTIRIPNLIDLDDLTKMLQSGARRFGQRELARLVWAWQGCDMSEASSSDGEVSDDELMIEHRREGEAGGLGFIVSKTRVGRAGKIENTYGVGISVSLKSNPQLPKFELLPPTSPSQRSNKAPEAPPSPSSLGRGRDGMSVVALWTQGKNARRTELERRLRAWGKRCSRAEQVRISPIYNPSLPPFPSEIPEIPRATLPSLEAAAIAVPGTLSPSPKKPRAPLNDVFGPAVPIAGPNRSVLMLLEESVVKHPPSAAKVKASERNRMMRERLAAKHAESLLPSTNQAFLSSIAEAASPSKSLKRQRKGEAEEAWSVEKDIYKRNAIISRLGNIADVVAMFSNKCGGRPSLVYDIALAVANSPLVKIGEDEAMESLHMLCNLFPDFSTIKAVDRQDWLYVKREARPTVVKARVAEELEAVRRRGGSNLA
ncbi:BZ3500_MvSof-1268-A1-R1_Chr2-1g04274 [Microbotryum saponariae]|uniref:BZ3500_MvSof-1268-A1-R1_Chr2-1g04274 protein n=1 Tax=Microbotryum saponariae TaxID=289078 RepID=A0A2X0KQ36_9BASI|nr:BZ3500_MvSof-1268-A1-R1_Chr2-1g04274 [Microbotryum saponariae]SCZ91289.1 BZ3501_MvSof-1269-A2-R1_Chr2-1g03930 [Microbotryum saponariae]